MLVPKPCVRSRSSEVATFQKIASKRCASWSQKKRLRVRPETLENSKESRVHSSGPSHHHHASDSD